MFANDEYVEAALAKGEDLEKAGEKMSLAYLSTLTVTLNSDRKDVSRLGAQRVAL